MPLDSFFPSTYPLIAREALFSVPFCAMIKIDPQGKKLAYAGAGTAGVLNLFVSTDLSLKNAKQATFFKEPRITQMYWNHDGNKLVLLKEKDGTGQLRLYGVDLLSSQVTEYTQSLLQVNAKVFRLHPKKSQAIIGLNHRNPQFHDLYLIDLDTGEFSLFLENDSFVNFLFDSELRLVFKMSINSDTSWTVFNEKGEEFMKISSTDAFHTEFLKTDDKSEFFYLLDNRFSNTTELKQILIKDQKSEKILGHDLKSDIEEVVFVKGNPVAYATYYLYKKWHPIDPKGKKEVEFLENKLGPSYSVLSQTLLGDLWVLVTDLPDRGKEFWLYNRPRQELSLLYASLEPHEFSKMYPLSLKARDGRELISYLTLPKEFDLDGDVAFPLPLVVFPHGGPFKVRDRYIFHPFHQWLASRGYAVLSVNFRLSSGFGKEFVSAGNGEWGGKAHLDVIDAVEECIKRGITEKGKLAVVGGSYGGYEALAGLTFTPDFYTCIVALCAPSNLKTVLQGVPSYWELLATPFSERTLFFTKKAFIISMGGDPEKPQEAPYLEKCSPLNYVDNIQKPLLLIHGANDHIVQEKESQQIYEGMKKSQKPVTYLSFPDEGHGIEKFANKMHFLALIEKFLAKHLGGREEPLQEEIQRASSANVQD